ncbi:MAG: SusC/RagA family TonB-linked outer membrane protein [Sphingobacteriales bacterium]|nr:SusC/RagA family TonB-linked outer membrane protein [Sphingobacteriales bacterium]
MAKAQKDISLSVKKEPLRKVLSLIEKVSDYRFLYTDDPVFENSRITLKVDRAPFPDVMQRILEGTGLGYTVNSNELVVLSFLTVSDAQAVIKGKITDEDGNPLAGATVQVKGSNITTVTDGDGNFSLNTFGDNVTLVITSVGYISREVAAKGNSSLNITLQTSKKDLSEVVVTALGISREKRTLGYATQKVDGAMLSESPASNFVNNIAGKVAGVNIVTTGAVGGSARITVRGETSITMSNNQPLYVIDGVPIGNDNTSNTSGGADYGNSAAEINPADIESMNVLKGPAAAALYGSRAAHGAIIITTKKGSKRKGIGVSFNSTYFMEKVARLPKFQNKFGQGNNGHYAGSNFGASWSIYPNGDNDDYDESWGPRLDNGTTEAQFDSPTTNGFRGGDVALNNRGDIIPTPWISHPDNISDFFTTGQKYMNNLSFSGGTDKSDYRLSLSSLNEKGVIPNNDLNRYQLNFNSSYHITSRLTTSINLNYVKQKSDSRPDNGYGRNTFMYFFTWMGRNVNMNSLRDYWQPGMEGIRQFQYNYGENHNNPFFLLYQDTKGQDKDRLYGNISIDYAFSNHLKLKLRLADDFYYDFRPMKWAVSTVDYEQGRYEEVRLKRDERNADFLLSYNNQTGSGDFTYTISAGGNRLDRSTTDGSVAAPQLLVPGVYTINNSASPLEASGVRSQSRVNSLYGMANIGYRDLVYMDLTARNDWSSTLPSNNNAYFYPSLGLNGNLKQILGMEGAVSQAQLRFAVAQVGNDAPPYKLYNTYGFGTPWGNNYSLVGSSSLQNPNLKPEITSTYEIGTSWGFINNRITIDATYYNIISKNQIIPLSTPQSAGVLSRVINAGEIRNRGVELVLSANPVNSKNFKWDFTINWSRNTGKLISLAPGVDKIVQAAPGEDASIQARVGEKMGAIWGPGYQRVEKAGDPMNGEIIIFSDAYPRPTSTDIYLGNANPDWIGGFYNQITYKNFTLNFLFAGQYGGKFISRFFNKAAGSGQLIEAELGRAARPAGHEYDAPYYIPGAAQMPDGSYQQNSTSKDDTYSEGVYGTNARYFIKKPLDHISEAQLFSSTYFKLRELSLGYNLPVKFTSSTFIKKARIAVTGRNLLLFTPKSNKHFDPEVSVATGGDGLIPGFENMSTPSTREMGLSLNLSF